MIRPLSLSASTSAGVVPLYNWNNLLTGSGTDALVDQQGSATNISVTYAGQSGAATYSLDNSNSRTTGNAQIPEGMDDGSTWLLGMVQMDAEEFIEWAKFYYEDEFDLIGEECVSAEFEIGTVGAGQDSQRGERGT